MLDVARPGPDYTLRRPRELFTQEGRALLAAQPVLTKKQWMEQVECLLEEAFITKMPVTDFRQSDQRSTWTDGEAVGLVSCRKPGISPAPLARSRCFNLSPDKARVLAEMVWVLTRARA